MAKRCLIISYYFPPVGGGGVQRIVKLIKFLSKDNWQLTILTAQNDIINLPEDKTILAEVEHLVSLNKVQINGERNFFSFLLNNLIPQKSSFFYRWLSAFFYIPDIRKSWLIPLHQSLKAELRKKNYDCILVTSPPYSLAVFASQITRELSIPVILDMRDPWTNNPYKIHPTAYHYKKDLQLELQSISKIKYGISAYKNLVDFYDKHIPDFNTQTWNIIPNGYDENDFSKLGDDSFNNGKFNIAFSGTFYSHINNPTTLLEAIAQLDSDVRNRIIFHHIGNTQINLNKIISRLNLENHVKLWDYLPHHTCLKQLNKMDSFCFILDDRNKDSVNTIGGKVYEYLRFRKPILALVPENGEAAKLINTTNSGEVISPNNTAQICETLEKWINGNFEYQYLGIESYSREKQARLFLNVLNRACGMDQPNN